MALTFWYSNFKKIPDFSYEANHANQIITCNVIIGWIINHIITNTTPSVCKTLSMKYTDSDTCIQLTSSTRAFFGCLEFAWTTIVTHWHHHKCTTVSFLDTKLKNTALVKTHYLDRKENDISWIRLISIYTVSEPFKPSILLSLNWYDLHHRKCRHDRIWELK